MKGTYILLIKVNQDVKLNCGKNWQIRKGLYAYIGSAMNNLQKRVCRHMSERKKYRWHIDYLMRDSTVLSVFIFPDERKELELSKEFAKYFAGPKGFGSSDLPVDTNLYEIDDPQKLISLITQLYKNHLAAKT
ncbi:MAG TPA: DUF123 domain-containing protein [Pseudothermotoga sp.]